MKKPSWFSFAITDLLISHWSKALTLSEYQEKGKKGINPQNPHIYGETVTETYHDFCSEKTLKIPLKTGM